MKKIDDSTVLEIMRNCVKGARLLREQPDPVILPLIILGSATWLELAATTIQQQRDEIEALRADLAVARGEVELPESVRDLGKGGGK